jgi:hypothetical protein
LHTPAPAHPLDQTRRTTTTTQFQKAHSKRHLNSAHSSLGSERLQPTMGLSQQHHLDICLVHRSSSVLCTVRVLHRGFCCVRVSIIGL